MSKSKHSGSCLCGAVKYQIAGMTRGVAFCHCSKCRVFHGHLAAYIITSKGDLEFFEEKGLKWYRSVTDETPNVDRGFCGECGSSLFWNPRDEDSIAVAAGSLHEPTGLKSLGHSWINQKGDYYEICDDLPRYVEGWKKSNLAKS